MPAFRAMTFNVRQMDGDDGAHSWPFRRQALVHTLRQCRPTVLGTQETWAEQAAYIREHLPDLGSFGRGRYGDDRDKHNTVFFDRHRLTLRASGERWFSATPEVPGSRAWGIPSPRMVTWGLLEWREGGLLLVLNTHFPYHSGGEEARRQSARLVRETLADHPSDVPALLLGDFNALPNGEVYDLLTQDLTDTWVEAEHRTGPEGTVHGFGRWDGPRIDWILHRNCGRVTRTEIVTATFDGLYPSDHYPVYADFNDE
ncbi:MAG: endonuclease/exonuclease/phosphatase family protein [Capsulimonadales bacterium]|nr:endonuclease/exonuclease/phosphatase family protein [Capsulimonadales bacterium]